MEGPEAVGLTGPLRGCILSVSPDTRSGNGSANGLERTAAYPRQARFQVLLGMIAVAEDLPEKAVEHNLKALKLNPRKVNARLNMGLTYLESGRPKEAIRCFENALSQEERADTRRFLERAHQKNMA
jgi:tetratricopeptide (TPR) repeat protein